MPKFSDYFNSTSIRGRANVAKATYVSFAALYLYSRFKKSNKKPKEIPENKETLAENHSPLDDFKCPQCKCNKNYDDSENKIKEKSKGLHEAETPKDSSTDSCKLFYNQDIPTEKKTSEPVLKSSTSKCEPECNSKTTDKAKESKSLKSTENTDLWWFSH